VRTLHQLLDEYPPTFVVGCPHSGSTLMQAVIGSHSNIHAIKGETRLFFSLDKKHRHIYQFYDQAIDCGKSRWVEKTPEHLHRIGAILRNREMAKVIIMIRDGRDVVASLFARTSKLRESVSRWKNDTKTALSFAVHPRVLLVKYEELVVEFKETTMRVFGFIGEEYEDAVKDFYKHQDAVDKPQLARSRKEILKLRAWQVSQPLFDGRGRYKELDEKQYDYVYRRQRKMLFELGYIQ
jgi:hypothetical protein